MSVTVFLPVRKDPPGVGVDLSSASQHLVRVVYGGVQAQAGQVDDADLLVSPVSRSGRGSRDGSR